MDTNIYETFRLRKKNTENVWVKLKLIPLWSLKWKYNMHAWHKKVSAFHSLYKQHSGNFL